MDTAALQKELFALHRRVSRLLCLLHLVVVALKVSELSFDRIRVPEGSRKLRLLAEIDLREVGIWAAL